MTPDAAIIAVPRVAPEASPHRRNLLAACLAHALHDGYTDSLYAFLPIWQVQLGLSYAGLASMRALYSGTMGGLQIPAERLLKKASARAALLLATVIAAMGFAIMALPLGVTGLCALPSCMKPMGRPRNGRWVSIISRAIWGKPVCPPWSPSCSRLSPGAQ